MPENYLKLNSPKRIIEHLEENDLSDKERQYYLQKLRLTGAGYNVVSAGSYKEK